MKMTYLDILKAVSEGTQPRLIKYDSILYTWDGSEYVSENGGSISDVLSNWTTKAQTTADFIGVIPEYLTEKEKKYLSAVIKPFVERMEYIKKSTDGFGSEYIIISLENDMITFPYFDERELYKGMELDKEYSLEELGL